MRINKPTEGSESGGLTKGWMQTFRYCVFPARTKLLFNCVDRHGTADSRDANANFARGSEI